jgi:hypothetical protein
MKKILVVESFSDNALDIQELDMLQGGEEASACTHIHCLVRIGCKRRCKGWGCPHEFGDDVDVEEFNY